MTTCGTCGDQGWIFDPRKKRAVACPDRDRQQEMSFVIKKTFLAPGGLTSKVGVYRGHSPFDALKQAQRQRGYTAQADGSYLLTARPHDFLDEAPQGSHPRYACQKVE